MSRLASTLFLIAQSQLTLISPQFIARSEINEMGRLRTDMGTKDFAYSIIESTDFNIVRWTTLYQPLYQLMWAALLPTLTESILSNISCSQIWSMLLRQPKLEEKMLSICRSSMLSAVGACWLQQHAVQREPKLEEKMRSKKYSSAKFIHSQFVNTYAFIIWSDENILLINFNCGTASCVRLMNI